jgi:hypothetical protein
VRALVFATIIEVQCHQAERARILGAYCGACNAVGAEPYGFTVGYVATCCGDTPAAVAEWFHEVIDATAMRAGKTVAEFWADVKAEATKTGA